MKFSRWIPWKFIIQRAARVYGVVDPITLLARLRRFAQPSEIQTPIELLRAGLVFHARGLINTRAIQNNLDWVWPFWVERQFNPNDAAFIPRAFSISHVNLTHRNWTAVGLPDLPVYPIVDPRGLVTPLYDGWSLDFWILTCNGVHLLPSRIDTVEQHLETAPDIAVRTRCRHKGLSLTSRVRVDFRDNIPFLDLRVTARAGKDAWLVAALRPYNPEGIQFIEEIAIDSEQVLRVNDETEVKMNRAPRRIVFSTYADGDVIHKLDHATTQRKVACPVGMATAAAMFSLGEEGEARLEIQVPLDKELRRDKVRLNKQPRTWPDCLDAAAVLQVPDEKIQYLYDTSLRTLLLLSADEVVPGPYTYRRFWFRDACLMMQALLASNMTDRCERGLNRFFERQQISGYFKSQDGEWDSNGQVLWLLDRYQKMTGAAFDAVWTRAILKGAEWIQRKRRSTGKGQPHSGLLPAGFSAEHFGPNDYYYWDDFWSISGLFSAARLAGEFVSDRKGEALNAAAEDFKKAVFDSIAAIPTRRKHGGIPASPYRRMDAGAVGVLAADYPLQLTPAGDARILATLNFLLGNCFHNGGFFQDMIHSGINAYLTLTVAQSLLRAGDLRHRKLVETVAAMASDTGQWPEAIHPITGGGCMGDGQHGWAAAEWIMMIRNMIVREEDGGLVVGSGLFPEWLQANGSLRFGPTPTPYGPVNVRIRCRQHRCTVELEIEPRNNAPQVRLDLPGFERKIIQRFDRPVELALKANA